MAPEFCGTIRFFCFLSFFCAFMSQDVNRLGWSCERRSNNTASNLYSFNLGRLFGGNIFGDSSDYVYHNTTSGGDPNKVYGLYLCRADLSKEICESCVNLASSNLVTECNTTKTAIMWFEECQVRSSDRPFSSSWENQPAYILSSEDAQNLTDPDTFRTALNHSFTRLIDDAISSPSKFATDIVNVTRSVTLYTLGQCVPVLSEEDCRACLTTASGSLQYQRVGSRYRFPSCISRFELYSFFGVPASPTAPTQPPLPNNITDGTNEKTNKVWVPVVVVVSIVIPAVLLLSIVFFMRRRNLGDDAEESCSQEIHLLHIKDVRIQNENMMKGEIELETMEDMPMFPLDIITEATQKFSSENKLGEGGFGPVYKGVLLDGKKIAVKRLSGTSAQGLREFKNEVTLIAKLQHKNLVKLLGCCMEGNELLLVYEYMPNKSLDFHLFDSGRSTLLDWNTRLSIISGIAKGLLYLHEDSRLKIIHRDLKASNVLLDQEMNPKISDFGLARLFDGNQVEANTIRVVGTYGYMAPEYAMEGLFSVKSDVFSFGVLLLEIISGRKSSGFYLSEPGLSLLHYTWRLWCEEQAVGLIDPVLENSYEEDDLLKHIRVGLLCVQQDPADRPTMSSIVRMMASNNLGLPQPSIPAFSVGRTVGAPQSSSDVKSDSVNDVTLSRVTAR